MSSPERSVPGQIGPAAADPVRPFSINAQVAALSFLLGAVYWPMIAFTAAVVATGDDMAHGLFAPIVAVFIVWQSREKLSARVGSPSAWGIPVLLVAGMLGVMASLGSSSTFSRVAFLGSLTGAVLVLGGARLLRAVAFPIALLLFTFPLPEVLYAEITLPLQLLASALAEFSLEAIGYSVLREGNILELPNQRLSVVEACSGIRSLITLSFLCLVYGYVLEAKVWLRALLFAASIPAAIATNSLRVTVTAMLGEVNPEWTNGLAHDSLGWATLAVGFGLVILIQVGLVRMLGRRR